MHDLSIHRKSPLSSVPGSAASPTPAANGGRARRWQFPKVGAASTEVLGDQSDDEGEDSSDDDQSVAMAAATSSRPRQKGKKGGSSTPPPSKPAGEPKKCCCCGAEGAEFHPLHVCREFRKLSVPARKKFVREHQNCWLCLKTGHLLSECTSGLTCKTCRGPHNTLLHQETQNVGNSPAASAASVAALSAKQTDAPI